MTFLHNLQHSSLLCAQKEIICASPIQIFDLSEDSGTCLLIHLSQLQYICLLFPNVDPCATMSDFILLQLQTGLMTLQL